MPPASYQYLSRNGCGEYRHVSMDKTNFLAAKGFLLSCLALILAGCSAGNGEGLDENGQPIPIVPPGASDFQEIQDTVFTPICTQCHIGANAPQGLRLDAANSYAMLVNVASNEVPGLLRVESRQSRPELPRAEDFQGTAAVGGRMPLGQAALPQDRIDLIRQWIAAGAPPAGVAPNNLTVGSSIPGAGEVATAGHEQDHGGVCRRSRSGARRQRHLRAA